MATVTSPFTDNRVLLHDFSFHTQPTSLDRRDNRPIRVRTGSSVYRFGPFQLDASRRILSRGSETIWLPDRHMDVLEVLAANAGQIVPKESLFEGAWREVAVGDNSIAQAITGLRKALGTQQTGAPYIETVTRRGYRFLALVECCQAPASDVALVAQLDPIGHSSRGVRLSRRWIVKRLHAPARRLLVRCGPRPDCWPHTSAWRTPAR